MILFFVKGGFNEEIHISIIYIICAIIGSFMILVFIEIIQLNFCGLSTMTKKNIEERAKLESIDTIDSILSDDEEDNIEDGKEDNNKLNKTDNQNKDINNDRKERKITIKGYCVELRNICNY